MSLNRPLIIVVTAGLAVTAGCWGNRDTTELIQGWKREQREAWYYGTQGSRLIPRTWFDALERADGERPFGDLEGLARYGFVAPASGGERVLPVGFANDRQDDEPFKVTRLRWYDGQKGRGDTVEPWLGLNCSACHTTRMRHDDVDHTFDGGPSLVDFQSFIEDLDAALHATRADPRKWDRFAQVVLTDRDTAANRTLLVEAFDALLAWQDRTAKMNATPMRYGQGRLDAVGHILNKILMFNGASDRSGNAANAPVSYPFLWGISKQRWVQWNGIAENKRVSLPGDAFEYGALGRNAGEVLGVFGEILVTPQPEGAGQLIRYQSSVRTQNLIEMELLVKDLQAPVWPAGFPAIDTALRDRGETLFEDHCADCHLMAKEQQAGKPTEKMLPFRETDRRNLTDIWMACNAFVYSGPTGPMKGVQDNEGNVMDSSAPVAVMLGTAVRGALIQQLPKLAGSAFDNLFGIRRLPRIEALPFPDPDDPRAAERKVCMDDTQERTLAYKGRPLEGIWATAPYLHNGSVASLHELLLPPDQRKSEFWVGNREFDAVNVGYADADPGDGTGFLLRTRDDRGRVIEGNSNAGHIYGADRFDGDDRRALVEYMKSL